MNRIQALSKQGQAIWLDFISREFMLKGKLRALVHEGVTGVTSNPTIFQKAIASGVEYDDQIRRAAQEGLVADDIYESLAVRDIAEAADVLRPVYNETHARDGFVSIEVSPRLAADTAGTLAEARRLFSAIHRPNVMIKVPATDAGIPAIEALIAEGINVNVTLIFSIATYEKVMQAYVDGLSALRRAGRSIGLVASVASFFVSRVDTLIDHQLTQRIDAGERGLETLRGQAAIANAKIAYDRFKQIFGGAAFAALRAAGGRVQRPLWASTGTKNPSYADTKYVDGLIGPETVNTVPPQTLTALQDHATIARTIDMDVEEAYATVERLAVAGIRMSDVTDALLTDGVKLFADSFESLIQDVEVKRARFLTQQRPA